MWGSQFRVLCFIALAASTNAVVRSEVIIFSEHRVAPRWYFQDFSRGKPLEHGQAGSYYKQKLTAICVCRIRRKY